MIGIINPLHFSEYWNSIPVLILKNIINKFNMTNLCGSPLKYLSKSMDKQWMLFSWLFKQWTILIQTDKRASRDDPHSPKLQHTAMVSEIGWVFRAENDSRWYGSLQRTLMFVITNLSFFCSVGSTFINFEI